MRAHNPISDYTAVLADALNFDRSLARRVRQEIEEHLWEAAAAEPIADHDEAQRRAIARLGDPRAIAAQFAAVSLARRSRTLAATVILAIGGAYALMKARLAWYAATQLVMSDEIRTISGMVARADGYAFWLSVVIGTVAWAYITSRHVPARLNPRCRVEHRRFFILCGVATTALILSVTGDAVLTGLRLMGAGWSPIFLLPVALTTVEIAAAGALAFLIRRATLRIRDIALPASAA